jgi:hypothetical protein
VTRGLHRVRSSPTARRADSRVSGGNLAAAAAQLPLPSLVLPVCARGSHPPRRGSGRLAGRPATGPLSSVPSGRVRSRPLTS